MKFVLLDKGIKQFTLNINICTPTRVTKEEILNRSVPCLSRILTKDKELVLPSLYSIPITSIKGSLKINGILLVHPSALPNSF